MEAITSPASCSSHAPAGQCLGTCHPASLTGRGFGQRSDTVSSEQLGWEKPPVCENPWAASGCIPWGRESRCCRGHQGTQLRGHPLTSAWDLGPPPPSVQEPLPPHSQVSGSSVGVSGHVPLPGWRTRPRCGTSPAKLGRCGSHWEGGTARLPPLLRTQESGSGKQMSNPDKSLAPLNIAGTAPSGCLSVSPLLQPSGDR